MDNSIEITREVREYADKLTDNKKATLYPTDAQEGMDEMSEKFKELGGQIYLKAGEWSFITGNLFKIVQLIYTWKMENPMTGTEDVNKMRQEMIL